MGGSELQMGDIRIIIMVSQVAPVVKNHCQCRRHNRASIPGLGRSPRGENGNPLQYSCVENPMDKVTWPGTVNGVAKTQTRLK